MMTGGGLHTKSPTHPPTPHPVPRPSTHARNARPQLERRGRRRRARAPPRHQEYRRDEHDALAQRQAAPPHPNRDDLHGVDRRRGGRDHLQHRQVLPQHERAVPLLSGRQRRRDLRPLRDHHRDVHLELLERGPTPRVRRRRSSSRMARRVRASARRTRPTATCRSATTCVLARRA